MNRPHLVSHATLWATTLAPVAVLAATPGLAAELRDVFGFALAPSPGSLSEAADIAFANGRVLAAIVLAAFAAGRAGAARPLLDGLVAAVVGANALLVGAAVGAYGVAALPWLVHLPVEWVAVATALGTYLAGRDRALAGTSVARILAVLAAVTAAAALLETYATPQ